MPTDNEQVFNVRCSEEHLHALDELRRDFSIRERDREEVPRSAMIRILIVRAYNALCERQNDERTTQPVHDQAAADG